MRCLLSCLVVTLWAAVAAAQPPGSSPAAAYVGKPVVAVRLFSEGRPAEDPQLLDLLETRVGQPLSLADVRESIIHFFSLGRFQDVQVDASEAPGGVALRYDLVPVHNVSRVEFRGHLGISGDDLRRAMEDRFGAMPPVGRAADVAALFERQVYPDQGYMHASVKWTPTVVHDPDRTFLAFDIDAGPRALIRNVTFSGQPIDDAPTLERRLRISKGQPYKPADLKARAEDYEGRLRKRGRYEARVTVSPIVSTDGREVDLRVDVQPGPTIAIIYRGDPLPQDKLKELVPVEREGSIDEDLLEDSARRITEYLNEQGYWKASAQHSPRQEGPDGSVTIAFTIVKGLQYVIAPDGVSVTGNRQVPIEVLRPTLQDLQPTEVFVASRLSAALDAIAAIYRTRGFARADLKAAVNELPAAADGRGQVQPAIVITEGVQAFVGQILFDGNQFFSAQELAGAVTSVPNGAYYQPRVESDRQSVQDAYRNAGFEAAAVSVRQVESADGSHVDLHFQITEGPQTIVDHVIIVGNTRTDPRIIQRELTLQPGKPLGLEDRFISQQRLAGLGLFRRIRIEELPHGTANRRDVLVSVEEAEPLTMSYGGGLEITKRLQATGPEGNAESNLEFAPRGFFDIGRRNIAGKNRSVNLFTRVGLRENNTTADATTTGNSGYGFVEYRVVGTYREPRALGMRAADLTVTTVAERGVRTSFNFQRLGVTADVSRAVGIRTRLSGRYSLGTTEIFDERFAADDPDAANIDRLFPQVRLSSFSGAVTFDTRDDPIEPRRGGLYSGETTLAARSLGGEVGFLKAYAQGSWFMTIPRTRRVVLAARAGLGMADGFPRTVETTAADGTITTETVEDLPASERFFAGGGTTIRGYPSDGVGAPNTIDENGFPKGGNALLILNAEVRMPVWKDFGAAFFVDGGNVFNRVTEFDFGELRGSYGLGLRYLSPIGSIRFDFGFKMDRRLINGKREPPMAFHFSIGQAF